MMSRPKIITDTGATLAIVPPLGPLSELPRYGVWEWSEQRGWQCIDTGHDLSALRVKHNVQSPVQVLGGAP
jgi:hypothetical protein